MSESARAVLQLIAAEGADAVVHSGDFDYNDDPAAWDAQINAILGANFPYFACVGNHDENRFYGPGGYQEVLAARLQRLGIPWSGDLGVQCSLVFQGIDFVFTAPGILGTGHEAYIHDHFATSTSRWRVSSHHKVQHLMQPEGKDDETGWGVYEEARKAGAIVATAHAHAYSRTVLLSNMEYQSIATTGMLLDLVADDPGTLQDEGASLAFVSGLGGKGTRPQEVEGPWFGRVYTETQNAEYGALFGVFNYVGHPELAHFYFKNIAGQVVDEFYLRIPVTSDVHGPGSDPGGLSFHLQPGEDRRQVLMVVRLPAPTSVSLDVLDVRGRVVATVLQATPQAAGEHRWDWDGRALSAGVYIARLRTPDAQRSARAVLLR